MSQLVSLFSKFPTQSKAVILTHWAFGSINFVRFIGGLIISTHDAKISLEQALGAAYGWKLNQESPRNVFKLSKFQFLKIIPKTLIEYQVETLKVNLFLKLGKFLTGIDGALF